MIVPLTTEAVHPIGNSSGFSRISGSVGSGTGAESPLAACRRTGTSGTNLVDALPETVRKLEDILDFSSPAFDRALGFVIIGGLPTLSRRDSTRAAVFKRGGAAFTERKVVVSPPGFCFVGTVASPPLVLLAVLVTGCGARVSTGFGDGLDVVRGERVIGGIEASVNRAVAGGVGSSLDSTFIGLGTGEDIAAG